MLKSILRLRANKKTQKRGYYIGAAALIVVAVLLGVFLILQNSHSRKANKESSVSTTEQESSNTTVSPPSQNTTNTNQPQAPAPSTIQPVPQPQPEVLANCSYDNGSQAGQHCPKIPPASYSTAPPCYYSNPSFSGTSPSCRPYDDVTSIGGWVDTTSGNSYCTFSFGAGSLKSYKNVQVSNSGGAGSTPDCSVERAVTL